MVDRGSFPRGPYSGRAAYQMISHRGWGNIKGCSKGLCAGLGGSILLFVVFMIFASVHRKRRRMRLKEAAFR
ncbi:uncharacterized protein BJX67DRAFT_346224 [Aspergillus lucknowensis]|uniref:Uncharacterized protein n=1 Tax=Aspergillus lucknowensis TaxID=176173 RepID=A0ABR4LZM7_9EURO